MASKNARPCDVAWIRSIVQQCKAAGVPVFVKQLGARPMASINDMQVAAGLYPEDLGYRGRKPEPLAFNDRKGGDPQEWPADLRIRQFPQTSNSREL